jgi:predicted metal-dependent phosphoesterase TrpH
VNLRIDVHVHTAASHDADAPVEAVLAAARDAGLDGVVVTDHDATWGARRAVELAPEYGLLALRGVEVTTGQGHLLALGVPSRPQPGQSFADAIAAVRRRGGVAVVPHPFQVSRHSVRKQVLRQCRPDGIEVLNAHAVTNYRNRRATRFARRHGYPELAGSDAHSPQTVGRAYTAVAVDSDADDPTAVDPDRVLSAIRAGTTAARGYRAPVRRYLGKLTESVRRGATGVVRDRRDVPGRSDG